MDPLSLYADSLAAPAAPDKSAAPAPAAGAGSNALDLFAASVAPAGGTAAPASGPANVQAFVTQYRPLADRIAKNLGVAPEALLGQWGLETGWGKSVIPGTNNLGNIKDFSGAGPKAKDNMTGSTDAYRKFETPEAFGDEFVGLVNRRYKSAAGTGRDVNKYFQALKTGGYAEDPDYVNKGSAAAKLAAAAMGTASAAAPSGEYFVGAAVPPPTPPRSAAAAINDTVIEFANAATGGAKAVSDMISAGNPVSKFLDARMKDGEAAQSDAVKAEKSKFGAEMEGADKWTEEVGAYLSFASRNPVLAASQAAGSFAIPGGAVKAAGWLAKLGGVGAAGASRAALAGGAAAGAALGGGDAAGTAYDLVMGTPDEIIAQSDDAKALLAQGMPMAQVKDQLGKAAAREASKIPAVAGALSGTVGAERLLAGIGRGGGRLAAGAKGLLTEGIPEAAEEGLTTYEGRAAAAKYNPNIDPMKGVAGAAAAGGVMGGVTGAGVGIVTGGHQQMPAELAPVAAKAAEPNSPLSKAAMASNTPELMAQRQAEQTAATQQDAEPAPADPAARLAELEAVAADSNKPGSRFFTPEERAEYDQLVEARAGTPGAVAKEADAIGDRAKEISAAVRESGALEQLRLPDSPVKAADLVKDLATAQSPNTPAAAREQALGRVEFALQWAGIDLAPRAGAQPDATAAQNAAPAAEQAGAQVDPVMAAMSDPKVSDQDKLALRDAYNTALNTRLPEATRQQARAAAQEIAGRYAVPPATAPAQAAAPAAVLGPIDGSVGDKIVEAERLEQGAKQFEDAGFEPDAQQLRDQADSLREAVATERAGETGIDIDTDPTPAPAPVAAPAVRATPGGEGPAYQRRRRASLQQLAGNGFTQVARQDGAFVMRNPTTGQTFNLENAGDAQLARKAISDYVAAAAAQTNTNPTDGQKSAGNYKKGRLNFEGLNLAIENPVGSERKGKDDNGEEWRTPMELAHYGYVVGSESADGDGSDIYLVNQPRIGAQAYVIDQYNEDGSFDETKTVLGAGSQAEALRVYDAGFSDGSGPDRRGAVTAMSVDDFKAWTQSPAAKKAAGAAPEALPGGETKGTMSVRMSKDNSVNVDLVTALPEVDSVARGGRALRVGKKQGAVLEAVASAFGKKIQWYTGAESGRVGDGFILPGDTSTIFLNATTGRSPIVVFGHELMHQLKRDNPEAHAAIEAVVARRANREAVDKTYGSLGYTDGQIMEELISDLGGDLMADKLFWADVMDEVRAANGDSAAKKILAQLAEFLYRAIGAISANVRNYAQTGAGSKLVDDMTEIRSALQSALAGYMQTHGVAKPAMQAEILRAGQDAKRSAARREGQAGTPEFKRWFGDSKVVDADGQPLRVFHGTASNFNSFSIEKGGSATGAADGTAGFFFTDSAKAASGHAELVGMMQEEVGGENVIPVYLSLQNPMIYKGVQGGAGEVEAIIARAKKSGHDGVIFERGEAFGTRDYVAFTPAQIKSAVGNRGTFDPADADITRSANREDALTLDGYHYSQQPRSTLVSSAYGTGLQGSDRDAIKSYPDERVRNRISFYVDKGTGIRPEAGVGGYAHRATLENVYDSNADVKRLKQGRDKRAFEAAVLDAGYDGYLDRMEGTQPGQVIMLGRRGIPVEQLGSRTTITGAKPVPAPAAREADLGDQIVANKALPSGELTWARWGEVLEKAMPEAHAQLEETGLFLEDGRAYKDGLVARARQLTAPVMASRLRDDPMEVSSRAPWGKTSSEDAVNDMLVVGLDSSKAGEKAFEKNIALVTEYPNYRPAKTANTTERQAERFIESAKDNLLWLYDQVPANVRERSHLWYDGANKIAKTWAPKYDLQPAQIAGVMAVLSPQKDWFMNVDLARRVIDTVHGEGRTRWDAEMTKTAERIFGKPQYADDVAAITGKRLADIDDLVLKAMWVRAYDETYNDRAHALLSPEGDAMGKVQTQKGENAKVAWGDLGSISKAVAIIEDGSLKNISSRLGGEHKVRNFYNNILVPNGGNGHVTIDTHAVAAALLRPLSGSSLEVLHNFGGAGAASNAIVGSSGTYGLYAEAYRRAAAERGVLPREMQSITWEAVRGLFTPGFKSQQKNVDATDGIWDQYRKGRSSLENARQQILDTAGGIEQPAWFRSGAGSPDGQGARDAGVVPGVPVPGRGAESAARGDGSPDAGTVPGDAAGGADAGAVRDGRAVQRSTERLASAGGQDQGPRGRQPDGSLIGLPRDFTVDGEKIVASAWGPAEEVARRYAESAGIDYQPPAQYVKVDPERATRIAAAYTRMKHAPQDPKVREAYAAMVKETAAQYKAVMDSGLKVEFIDFASQGDPYAGSPRLMTEDVRKNNHMWVFSTRDGFGSDAEFNPEDNPLLAETEFKISGRPALANDLFRVVHDYFGHVKEGVGFRADGEENTWRSHSAMFTPLAQRALTTETRGQNSWVNYGPYGETNRKAGAGDTHYADQKVGLLPKWASEDGRYDTVPEGHAERVAAVKELIACLGK